MHDRLYAVVLAGGVGSRLWPRSRTSMPKQFLDLLGPRTMLQETIARIEPLIPLERTLVVVGQEHAALVREQVPGLPEENAVLEPAARNTAPCIGLAAVALQQRDPEAVMAIFPADHCIADGAGFRRAVAAAVRLAEEGHLVTLGVTPNQPHTGYGYIQRGPALGTVEEFPAFQVLRFAEKPDLAQAQAFVDSGEYYWNAGIFVWRADRILAEIARHMPPLSAELQALAAAWRAPGRRELLARAWERVPRTSIDYGVMERAERVAVVPLDVGWDDVGNWAALADLAPGDEAGNTVHGGGRRLLLDTQGSYLYTTAGRMVALVGVEGLIVVDTPDALLICSQDRAQAVRDVVERLKAEGLQRYL